MVDSKKVEILEHTEGKEFNLGKRTFLMPPLPFTVLKKSNYYGTVAKYQEQAKSQDINGMSDTMEELIGFIFLALKMNYPDITENESINKMTVGVINSLIPYLEDSPSGVEQSLKNVQRVKQILT